MWPTTDELPDYGVLSGVRVVHATQAQAAPFGVSFLADFGADVIWIENARVPDVRRFLTNRCVESDSRNQRNISLNIPSEKGRKIFLDLLKDADIFIECSKGGQYDRWGLSDEVLWETNPRLVIVHESGFGQTGDPSYISRPAFDSIAQAFSSYMDANRNPITPPYPVGPFVGDFMTGVYIAMASLAALTKARATGVGESVDIAQFECLAKAQQYQATWLTDHETRERAGDSSPMAGYGTFLCSDGNDVQLQLTSAN
ncbi:MAG: CoA transferase, partial [Eggerthellaceae bacterium]|nr:CoA transferase [Eggerthellaceae bacterium]